MQIGLRLLSPKHVEMWTNLVSSKLDDSQGIVETPSRCASPYYVKNPRRFPRSKAAATSQHAESRYLLQKARVPREVCASSVLVDRLTGFMLKPVSRVKGSKARREHLRQEIEGQQQIKKHDNLWHGDDLSYVAEAKARTIQLRNRTLRLFEKVDSYEQLPEQNRRVSMAPHCCSQTFEVEVQEEQEERQIDQEENESNTENEQRPQESTSSEESEDYHSFVDQDIACHELSPTHLEEPTVPPLPVPTSSPSRSPSKRRATLRLDAGLVEIATFHGLAPTLPISISRGPSRSSSRIQSRASSPGGNTLTPSRPSSATPRGEHQSKSPNSRPSSRAGAVTPGSKKLDNARKPVLLKSREGLKARMLRRTFTKDEHAKYGARQGILSNFLDKQFLFEEKRMIVIEQDGKSDPNGSVAGLIRISENKESAGGMLFEVCLNQKGWTRGDIVERVIHPDEIQNLFSWGNKQSDAAEARYKWLSDLIVLKVLEDPLQSESASSTKGGHNIGYGIIFNGYDNVDETERTHPGLEQFRTEVHSLFKATKELCKEEAEFTNFSLRIGFHDKRQSVREARKELEIESARKRFDLYENTSRALHGWYTRLDVTGDGQIDEEEFGIFMQGIVNTICKSDVFSTRKQWSDFKTFNGSIGFTQFVTYLIGKFPHVKNMTAFEVKRFEEKAKRAPHQH